MNKIAFMFPGQGAQYVGMGQDFYENVPVSREVVDLASQVTDLDLPAICFQENDKINITEYTQIAMQSVSVAILEALRAQGIVSHVNAGLSLGEYGALVASEVLTPAESFALVRKRGIYMQEAVPTGGAMSAVLGADTALVEECCEEVEGIVSVANYNCPGQVVISGESEAVAKATVRLKEAGVRRVLPLKVSGPFHSAMLKGAGEKLRDALQNITPQTPKTPYVCNVSAQYVTEAAQIPELLVRQVYSPVRWQQSVEAMIANGVDTFIEIGPGKTLCGFMKKIDPSVNAYNISNIEEMNQVVEVIKNAEE